jgi:bifunctional UDP-N-acetylglucosamine pyrophosphorylase/glucosamine-1-phosphate N-acetyltransferase
MNKQDGIGALVLAAGKGKRMKSPIPKVLQPLLEEPLLNYPLAALSGAGVTDLGVVVGHGAGEVETFLLTAWPSVTSIRQNEQKGTGHAVKIGRQWWEKIKTLLVLPGDAPLITREAIESLLANHLESRSSATFLSFEVENPAGYGRVIRSGNVCRIVEEKDATSAERCISEVNSGIYAFETKDLVSVIELLENRNAQGEFYLPDVLPLLAARGLPVEAKRWETPDDLAGINDPFQLAQAGRRMRDRILNGHLTAGVKLMDPETTWIGPRVILEPDVHLHPNVQVWGKSVIETGATIGSHSILRNALVRRGAELVAFCCVTDSEIGSGSRVGPFACLRDNTRLSPRALVGKFVETKNSVIGEESKVPHLSYIGDAIIGKETNIGAGTITCNYDGERKNPTRIGDHCFIGSDTMLVAPVTLHDECFTAAGSTITEDVPRGALAVGRARQRNIEGWARRKGAVPRKEED